MMRGRQHAPSAARTESSIECGSEMHTRQLFPSRPSSIPHTGDRSRGGCALRQWSALHPQRPGGAGA
eukprot:scaffold276676_cov13-Tisochrysis_lutea.AAC.1